jgi:hypothetical protein
MQIPLPPGYQSLVPFDRDKHRNAGIAEAKRGPFAAGLHGVQVLVPEFTHAARHYPVVFVRDSASGKFLSLAVTGMDPGTNLYVGADGKWADHFYVPAYVRRWPFFTTPIEGKTESLVLVDEQGLEPKAAEPLFDAEGKDTELWRRHDALIRELEGARVQHDRFMQTLQEHRLLQPFEAHAFPKGGRDLHLVGMHRVDENRLNALEGRVIKGMMKRGELSRIYAHLMSLDNFRYLMDRATARAAMEK